MNVLIRSLIITKTHTSSLLEYAYLIATGDVNWAFSRITTVITIVRNNDFLLLIQVHNNVMLRNILRIYTVTHILRTILVTIVNIVRFKISDLQKPDTLPSHSVLFLLCQKELM